MSRLKDFLFGVTDLCTKHNINFELSSHMGIDNDIRTTIRFVDRDNKTDDYHEVDVTGFMVTHERIHAYAQNQI